MCVCVCTCVCECVSVCVIMFMCLYMCIADGRQVAGAWVTTPEIDIEPTSRQELLGECVCACACVCVCGCVCWHVCRK